MTEFPSDVYGVSAATPRKHARTPSTGLSSGGLPPKLPSPAIGSPSWRLKLEAMQNQYTMEMGAPASDASQDRESARKSLSLLRADPGGASDDDDEQQTAAGKKAPAQLQASSTSLQEQAAHREAFVANAKAALDCPSQPKSLTGTENAHLKAQLEQMRAEISDCQGDLEIEQALREADALIAEDDDETRADAANVGESRRASSGVAAAAVGDQAAHETEEELQASASRSAAALGARLPAFMQHGFIKKSPINLERLSSTTRFSARGDGRAASSMSARSTPTNRYSRELNCNFGAAFRHMGGTMVPGRTSTRSRFERPISAGCPTRAQAQPQERFVDDESEKSDDNEQGDEALLHEIERQAGLLAFVKAQLSHSKEREKSSADEIKRLRDALAAKTDESNQYKDGFLQGQVENTLCQDLKQEMKGLRGEMEHNLKLFEAKVATRDREIVQLQREAEERDQVLEDKEQEHLRLLVQQAQLKTELQKVECDQITKFLPREQYDKLEAKMEDLELQLADREAALEAKEREKEIEEVKAEALREELEDARKMSLQMVAASGAGCRGLSDAAAAPELLGSEISALEARHRGEISALKEAKDGLEKMLLEELLEQKEKCKKLEQGFTDKLQAELRKVEELQQQKLKELVQQLTNTFESDWRDEEENIRVEYDTKIARLEHEVGLLKGEKEGLAEEKEGLRAKGEKMAEDNAELRAGLSVAERQLQSLQEAQWEVESLQRQEILQKQELTIKCRKAEKEVGKLRAELQNALVKAEEDHLSFRSAEACLQQELIQLRKKILKTELQGELEAV